MQSYQEALDYLYSFTDYGNLRTYRYSAETFDLGRMRALMAALGNPHDRFPSLHVTGTKGKGSTSALCAAVLRRAGYRTGFYSSPHLQDFRERIQVDGQLIAPEDLVETVAEIRPAVAAIPGLTAFELITATAFVYFARRQVDFAVIEVGLGGRLDATNVITPLVSAITSLSYDHMHLLGNSLAEIAGEKAGIIKVGVPVVSAPQQPEALAVIERVAAERGAPLWVIGRDWLYAVEQYSLEGQSFSVWPAGNGNSRAAARLKIPLLGAFQAENGAVAYVALRRLRERGLAIPDKVFQAGFGRVDWPGRFEVLSRGSPALVADCAHNGESARRLVEALDDYFPGRPVTLLFGASADKDVTAMFDALLPRVERAVMTQAIHPRAIDPDELAGQAAAYGVPAEAAAPVAEALRRALQAAGARGVVVATGSLFVVAEVRAAWDELPINAYRQSISK
jgi:dihydrofolate synthase/folylpolyglutamate synthase